MKFEKWQALGNDYLIVEEESLPWRLTAGRARRLCDPHFGIGSDGVLLLSRSEDPAYVAELRIFNPDGSEAELSGNGAREAILYLRRNSWTDADTFSILTAAGPIAGRSSSSRPSVTSIAHWGLPIETCWKDHSRPAAISTPRPSGLPEGKSFDVVEALPISTEQVRSEVIVGVIGPAAVRIEKVSASVQLLRRR